MVKLSFLYETCRCFESIKLHYTTENVKEPTGQSLQIILNLMLLG